MAVLFLNIFVTLLIINMSLFAHAVKQSDVECHGVYPGTDKIINGVDITTLDLVPLDGSAIAGLRHPVIKLTCNKAKTKYQPSSKTYYNVPDQLVNIMLTGSGSKSASVEVSRSYKQLKEKLASTVGLSARYKSFAFSSSTSYTKTQNSMLKTNREVLDVTSKRRSHNIQLHMPKKLEKIFHPSFQTEIYSLEGKTFLNNRDSFEKLISYFGTHFIQEGSFGGMLRKYTETDSSYSWTKTDEELAVQAKASYNIVIANLNASVGVEKGYSKVNSILTNSSTGNVQYYGGDANVLSKEGISNWQPTVDRNPVLLSAQVKPLYDLVSDEAIKRELKAAIDEYVFRNFLTEMQRKINAAMKYRDPLIGQFSKRLEFHINSEFLDIEEVKALDEEIVYETDIPYWFSHETKFCLKYKVDDSKYLSKGPCNLKKVTDTFTNCVIPNQYTEQFNFIYLSHYKNTCKMHYGLKTIKASDWFNNKVKICVSFQIGSTPSVQCASPSRFTSGHYIDDIKAKLRWKIEVDDGVPLWIKKSELCFEWDNSTDINGKECKAGSSKKRCARTGDWTPTFKSKNGIYDLASCKFQWSWRLLDNDH